MSYPIVFQLSVPRSGSTILFRAIEAQNVFHLYHEPTIKPYDLIHYPEDTDGWFKDKETMSTFDQVEQEILTAAQSGPVYVKDMVFSSYDWLIQTNLIDLPNVYFLFIVRKPDQQLFSIYHKYKSTGLNPFDYFDVIDYQKVAKLADFYRESNPNGIKVISCEDLFSQPENVLTDIFNWLPITIPKLKLTWEPKPQDFDGSEWHESKTQSGIWTWHSDAISSTQFRPMITHNTENYFDPEHRDWIQNTLDHNSKFYDYILHPRGEVIGC